MAKPVVLWADLTIKESTNDLREQFAQRCIVRATRSAEDGASLLELRAPNLVCLEYDFPDKRGLAVLQETKRKHPSIPVIIITLAHSEALAVWAFRAGAWDYLAKPVEESEVERICLRLERLLKTGRGNSARLPATVESDLPREMQYVAKARLEQSIAPAMTYIQSHFADKISEKYVASLCDMSTFRFSRAFREFHDMTFREWLVTYRVSQSRRFLENPELAITQVAFMCGFSDASHFAKMFRRYCGQTATEYRSEIEERRRESETLVRGQREDDATQPEDELRTALCAPGAVERRDWRLHKRHSDRVVPIRTKRD